jgi:hypothetical protein
MSNAPARQGAPLQKGEKLREKIEEQLARIQKLPSLIRSFFKVPSVAYIGDWLVSCGQHHFL